MYLTNQICFASEGLSKDSDGALSQEDRDRLKVSGPKPIRLSVSCNTLSFHIVNKLVW